jgi:hypothetical protein
LRSPSPEAWDSENLEEEFEDFDEEEKKESKPVKKLRKLQWSLRCCIRLKFCIFSYLRAVWIIKSKSGI